LLALVWAAVCVPVEGVAAEATGQTAAAYYVRALGPVAPDQLRYACRVIREKFSMPCRVMRAWPLPSSGLDLARNQYDADRLIDLVFRDLPPDGIGLIAITNADLREGARHHFVFGLASLVDHVGLVSLARLRETWWGSAPEPAIFRDRFYKVLIHEVGHTLGVPHCDDDRCAMRDDRVLADLDESPRRFCARCRAQLRSGVAQAPGTARWHYLRGHSHLNRAELARAVYHFQRAVDIAPDNARHHNDLGVAYLRRGDRARALWCFRHAARLDREFAMAHYNEGLIHVGTGDAAMARRAFDAAARRAPGWAPPHRELGYLYAGALAEPDRAVEHFEQYIVAAGEDPSVLEKLRLIKGGTVPAPGR
jgi:archaemetzincin